MTAFHEQLLLSIDERLPSYLELRERLVPLFLTSPLSQHDKQLIRTALITEMQQQGLKTYLLGDDPFFIYADYLTGATHTLLCCLYCGLHVSELLDAIVTALAVLDIYQRLNKPLPINMKWLIDIEGMLERACATKTLQHHRELLQADGCLWHAEEPADLVKDACIVLGTKGLLRVVLEVCTVGQASSPIHLSYGTIVPNAAWRLTWALNSLKNAQEEILIEGFYETVTPLDSDEIMLLHALPDVTGLLTQHYSIEQPLLGLQGVQLHYAHQLVPTCVISAIHSGLSTASAQSFASLPTYAQTQLDFYLVPGQDPDDVFTKLRRHLDTLGFEDVRASVLYKSWPTHTSLKSSFAHAVQQAMHKAHGHEPYVLLLTMGSYPISTLQQQLALPIVIAYPGYLAHDSSKQREYEVYLAKGIKQFVTIVEEVAKVM
ncbi:MAG: peptidase dimerization domain-containing protein [Ktedonobacteraceae bacterium]|nr:peptidase dimerization domain-containing protein [Ktedonobacteraceae bacterium]MBV9021883.1 peptidase dimerization domain-containing protein [Ktedonobacteraceae bacterium]